MEKTKSKEGEKQMGGMGGTKNRIEKEIEKDNVKCPVRRRDTSRSSSISAN